MPPEARFSSSQGEATPRDGSDRNQQEHGDFFDGTHPVAALLLMSVDYDRPA
jgi:hypothetical protein